MYRWEIMTIIARQRVVGIIRSRSAGDAHAAGQQLIDAGLRVIEVALTTPGGLDVITTLARDNPGVSVGAGTVLDQHTAGAAADAGAAFLVAPNLVEGVIRAGHRRGLPVIPGAGTASEIMTALEMGADAIKLFPASGYSPGWLSDLRSALPQVPVLPTGGVTLANAAQWIRCGAIGCGMGSALTQGDPGQVSNRVSGLLADLASAG